MARGGVLLAVDQFNVAAPGANTNILSANQTPVMAGFWVVQITLTTGSVLNVTETRSGTTFTNGANKSTALNAGDMYSFIMAVSSASAYNFQVETNSVIRELKIFECYDFGVAQSIQGT